MAKLNKRIANVALVQRIKQNDKNPRRKITINPSQAQPRDVNLSMQIESPYKSDRKAVDDVYVIKFDHSKHKQ
jgi:hypothetical protein